MRRIASTFFRCLACQCALLALVAGAAQAAAPQQFYTNSGSARVHYVNQGSGPEAVVFIHGWGCDLTFWQAQTAALSQERRVLALDLLGFGKSDAPGVEYTQDLLAKSLAAVLDAAGVQRAVLVAHSMGLSVAKRYIDTHPDRVAGLFIVDGAYVNLPKDEAQVQVFREMLAKPETGTPKGWRHFVSGFVGPMLTPSTSIQAREKILSAMQGAPIHVAKSSMLHFMEPGGWSSATATVPVRAVYAAGPSEGRDVRGYLSTVFPGMAYEEWDNTGHFIMFDQSERLSAAIALFAAQVLQ